jgi:hypothetical protein
MDYEGEGFGQFSSTQGRLRFESDGKVDEKDYSSANFINSAGTVGYSETTVDGKPDHIFISKTAAGIVLTIPGEQTGPAPFPVEGYKALASVMSGSPAKAFYEAHLQALAGETPLSDRAWLEKEVPLLPQRALDVTMKIFAIVCEQMEKMMSGMGNAMGQMIEGMGKAMGQAMEGVGQAMGEMVQGAGAEEAIPEKPKAAEAPRKRTQPAPKEKPAMAKAAPVRKAKAAKAKPAAARKPKKARARKARKAPVRKPKKAPARKKKAPVKRPKRKGGAKKRK